MEWWYMSSNLVLETVPIKLPKWLSSLAHDHIYGGWHSWGREEPCWVPFICVF